LSAIGSKTLFHTRHCVVNLESIESVALGVLTARIGRLAYVRMRQLCEALEVAVDYNRRLSSFAIARDPAVGARL